jgi:hypothetical protein
LLVNDILVGGHEKIESVRLSRRNKFTVADFGPTSVIDGFDQVIRQSVP